MIKYGSNKNIVPNTLDSLNNTAFVYLIKISFWIIIIKPRLISLPPMINTTWLSKSVCVGWWCACGWWNPTSNGLFGFNTKSTIQSQPLHTFGNLSQSHNLFVGSQLPTKFTILFHFFFWHERAAFQRSSFGRSRLGGRLLAMT